MKWLKYLTANRILLFLVVSVKMSIQLFLNQRWKDFSSVTGIKGFTFLSKSTSKFEAVLWTSALIAGFCVTIWDVFETINSYFNLPIMTKVEVQKDSVFNLSQVTFCTFFNLSPILQTTIERLLLNADGFNLSEYLLSWQMLGIETANSTDFHDSLQIFHILTHWVYRLSIYESFNSVVFAINSNFSLEKFPEFMTLSKHITHSRTFYRLFAQSLWCILQFKVLRMENSILSNTTHNCLVDATSWIGSVSPNTFQSCVIIPHKFLLFNTLYEHPVIEVKKAQIFRRHQYSFIFGSEAAFNFEVDNFISFMSHTDTEFNIGSVTIQLLAIYNSFNSSKSSCTMVPKFNCKYECQVEFIRSSCHCEPFTTIFIDSSSSKLAKPCDFSSFTNVANRCTNFTQRQSFMTSCAAKCGSPCQRFIYSLNTKELNNKSNTDDKMSFYLQLKTFIYPIFHEKPAITTKQLLAQLGGNLSLWLGSSFLVLAHILVFLIRLPIEYFAEQRS